MNRCIGGCLVVDEDDDEDGDEKNRLQMKCREPGENPTFKRLRRRSSE